MSIIENIQLAKQTHKRARKEKFYKIPKVMKKTLKLYIIVVNDDFTCFLCSWQLPNDKQTLHFGGSTMYRDEAQS